MLVIGCVRAAVELDRRSCGDGDCAEGYACNPLTSLCVPPLNLDCSGSGVCPLEVHDGDACAHTGSFVPCAAGTTGCESGCRTCGADNTWSACSCIGANCACFLSNGGVEVCDGFDNDCQGGPDDGEGVEGCVESWVDNDGDGFGAGDPVCYCGLPTGRALLPGDPNDDDPLANPDTGDACDGLDTNGDGSTLARELDDDGDGYVECSGWIGSIGAVLGGDDCNDDDAAIYPGAFELHNGRDDDCDGRVDECTTDCACGPGLVSCYQLQTIPVAADEGPAGVSLHVDTSTGVLAPGIQGDGYLFDGSYQLEAPASSAHDLTRFSISTWVRIDSPVMGGGVRRYIVDVQGQYAMWQEDKGDLVCAFAGPSSVVVARAGGALDIGRMMHLGCSYDGTAIRVYVDGLLDKTQNTTVTPRTDSAGKLVVGAKSPDAATSEPSRFIGVIDHLKIYDQPLGAARMCAEARRTDCASF